MKLFEKKGKVTINIIQKRLADMEQVAKEFICEEESHRQAKQALFHNMSMYQGAIDAFVSWLNKPGQRFAEYQRRKYELAIACGGRETQLSNNATSVTDVKDVDQFFTELQKLNLEYSEEIREAEKIKNENEQLMNDEIEDLPEPKLTSYNNFPDSVPVNDLRKISFMIKEIDEVTTDR